MDESKRNPYQTPRLEHVGDIALLTASGSGQNPENQAQQEATRQRPSA